MSVFISWSGVDSVSHRIAVLLRDWLPKVIQRLECFLSSKDIDAGALWFDSLKRNLELSNVGVLCLTNDSILKPWILFEAGFIARSFEQNRVYPLMIGLKPSEIPAPLAIFQAGTIVKSDMLKMVEMINLAQGDSALNLSDLEESFNLRWSSFEEKANQILSDKLLPNKSEIEVLKEDPVEEILKLVRGMASGTIPVTPRYPFEIGHSLGGDDINISSFIKDSASSTIFDKFIKLVWERRPLINSWIECAKYSFNESVLTLKFPRSEEHAFESLRRPNQIDFLQKCATEIGIKGVTLKLVS